MSVFDSQITTGVGTSADAARTPNGSEHQVGWVAALVWPAVWTAVVAGALIGTEGRLLFWAGVAGVLGMFLRQAVKIAGRNIREAGRIIDAAPGGRLAREAREPRGTARYGE